MKRLKKLVLSLSIVLTMSIAFVLGIVCSTKTVVGSAIQTADKTKTNGASAQLVSPTEYYFEAGEVKLQSGENDPSLDYEYDPNVVELSNGNIAYKYSFTNTMKTATAVSLKDISTDKVSLSYAWQLNDPIDVENESFTSYSIYSCEIMPNEGDTLYVYIIVTPKEQTIPASFNTSVEWWYGEPGELNIILNGNSTTQTIVKGQEIDFPIISLEGTQVVTGWYLDSALTKQVTFPFKTLGTTLYPKIGHGTEGNLPADWLTRDGGHYVVTKGTSTLPSNLIIQSHYNGLPITHIADGNIEDALNYDFSTLVFGMQQGITSVSLPNTMTYIGAGAFAYCSSLTNVTLPDSIETINVGAFAFCLSLQSVKLPKNLTALLPIVFVDCPNLTYVDASVVETVSYDYTDGAWVYNSTDSTPLTE